MIPGFRSHAILEINNILFSTLKFKSSYPISVSSQLQLVMLKMTKIYSSRKHPKSFCPIRQLVFQISI